MVLAELTLNRLYKIDCIEGMKKLPCDYIDLIITSPPYNLDIKYDMYIDNKTIEQYYQWCRKWIKESYRVLKKGGRFCLQIGCFQPKINEPSYCSFTRIFQDVGFIFRDFIIWNKKQISNRTAWGSWKSCSNPRILPPFEMIINFHKESPTISEKGITDLKRNEFIEWTNGLWNITAETRSKHPAAFPIEIPYRLIKLFSYVDAVVLDPFIGSGTTACAAKVLDRRYIGFDISNDYIDMSQKRKEIIPKNIESWI